jgi:hypothetical protein
MQDIRYAADFNELASLCHKRNIALQTMKSTARWPCAGHSKNYNTYFYEPLETQESIDRAVHWSLGFQDSFLITAGDMQLLPKVLDAANRFEKRPSDAEMKAIVDEFDIRQIFPRVPHRRRGKGPQTWGGQMSKALQELVREGYFKHPNKRTLKNIAKALESKGISTKDKEDNIRNSLAGRVKKGILKRSKTPSGRIYWTA